ncbi:MAG: hypothetical protein A3F12_03740 [Gammaproteobacteria bacterium RIFCSPHIGHO2_12_FULL_38_14]|nr:MAG: hypothetical protein A3F12_03740 [Gammaproteobacteria bacterium RIFCSPHIGHO2_12_FULL_38_14]
MWGSIKRIFSGCYYYAKELFTILWHSFGIEGEAVSKAASVGYDAYRRGDPQAALQDGASDVFTYVKEHPVRTTGILLVVLARYATWLGLASSTKSVTRTVLSPIQTATEKSLDKVKDIYQKTWEYIHDAYFNKYLMDVPFHDHEWISASPEKITKWARKVKLGLQQAWEYEKRFMRIVLKLFPNQEWEIYFNNRKEYKKLQECIQSFAALETKPSKETLNRALNAFKKLKSLMWESNHPVAQTFFKTTTGEVLTIFGHLSNSNPIFMKASLLVNGVKKIFNEMYFGHNALPLPQNPAISPDLREEALPVPVQQQAQPEPDQNEQALLVVPVEVPVQQQAQLERFIHQDHEQASVRSEVQVTYPKLLTQFGCYQRKVNTKQVANTLWLIEGKHGPRQASEVKKQFSLWAKNAMPDFDIQQVEEQVRKIYHG